MPWPPSIQGRVIDDEGKPVAGASVVLGGQEHRTADDGSFTLTPPPHASSLIAKRPGYRRVVVEPTQDKLEIVLKPQVIKAATLSGADNILFRRNSVSGAIEAVPWKGEGIALNAALHAN